ncbi:hypothetical protein MMB17_09075 [Methylobacterium organophilum]|uniref:hypothetical protein n=1 Tax=Methylobacterium organophilum TaxID=410 RepID=UPI001F136AFC|nr:hypothetical protein [Methylobacterium organophilum]UMY19426.1 hypothetical protein MMB17_09075 [Methylobacterium organophilum]
MKRVVAGLVLVLLSGVAARAAEDFWGGAAPKPAAPVRSAGGGLAEVESLEAALAEAWEKTPLTQRHVVFVSEKAALYGAYTERPSRVFAKGEDLVTYLEPIGFTWKADADGVNHFGFVLDFTVKSRDGKVLAGQDGFQRFDFASRYKNREVFMNITMSLNGIEPGDYVLGYALHDRNGNRVSRFEQPFAIKE